MQYTQRTFELEKVMTIVVAALFAAVSLMIILLYSNSNNIFAQSLDITKFDSIEINSILAREEVK